MDWAISVANNLRHDVLSFQFFFSPVYVLMAIAMAYIFWVFRRPDQSFFAFLFPADIYRHPSTLVDVKIAAFNIIFKATGAISALYLTPYVTNAILNAFGALNSGDHDTPIGWAEGIAIAAVLFLIEDFCRFLNHYWHHKSPALWPAHSVHHSAEVMSPITFMRAHPIYHALQQLLISAFVGTVQAFILLVFIDQIDAWIAYASALAFQLYVFFGVHLRHSHIRFGYGRFIEHILISPAQHQVHHSIDPKHYDKNFGEVFAIWDWMFGTLYLSDPNEELNFGVADEHGQRLDQPHPTLKAALIKPFIDGARALRRSEGDAASSQRSIAPSAEH